MRGALTQAGWSLDSDWEVHGPRCPLNPSHMHPTERVIAPLVKGTEEPLFSEREIPFIFPRNEVMIFTYGNSTGTTIKGMNHSTWDGF